MSCIVLVFCKLLVCTDTPYQLLYVVLVAPPQAYPTSSPLPVPRTYEPDLVEVVATEHILRCDVLEPVV
jgi:hypothetical protein